MLRVILVRHGETIWNIEGRYQGQKDIPLSTRGVEQARLLAAGLRDVPLDAAVSSPLRRALDTCLTCIESRGLTVETDSRLMEIKHGAWEGMTAEEIEAAYPGEYRLWHTAPYKVQMPGGENLEDVRCRARAAFDDYARRYDGRTLLVAAHDAVNKAVICDLLGMGLERFWQVKQDNTCINVLECQNGVWRVVLLNSVLHMGCLYSGIEQAGL